MQIITIYKEIDGEVKEGFVDAEGLEGMKKAGWTENENGKSEGEDSAVITPASNEGVSL